MGEQIRLCDPVPAVCTGLYCIAALALAACADSANQAPAVVSRDSAGIAIVESSAPRWTSSDRWLVGDRPRVQIGLTEGEPAYLFSNIEGALLLRDGRVVVADRGSSQIRFFTSAGVFESAIGGPGDGPGELGYIRDLARCGADSLFVFEIDYLNVVFRIDGDYVREAQPYDANSMTRRPYAMRCARNGYYVAVGWENLQGPRTIGFYRAEAPTWILAPTHQLAVEPIESIPGAGLNVVAELGVMLSSERIGRATGSGPHPFGRALQLAISTEAVYLGTGEAFEVRRYDLNGQLVGLFRWPGHDLTIQDMDLEAYRVAALAAVSEAGRPALERSLREMPMPATLPAFSRIETDMAGNVWIESFRKPGQPSQNRRWTVIDAQGVLLGDVAIPVDLEVTDIGENAIVGVARDELGVERVCVYDLVKPVG